MRELHIHVSEDHRGDIRAVLDEHGVDFVTVPDGDDGTLFLFALPTAAVSEVLDDLDGLSIDEESYTVMTKAELAETSRFTALHERYSSAIRTLSKRELHAKIREIQWPGPLYYIGTVLSVLAAAAGLLLDQPALVIGAMIIAPQASSALAAPAGVFLSDWEMFVTSIREQIFGLGLAIIGAVAFGWFVRWTGFVPAALSITQVELIGVRLAPTFFSTTGAIIAGVVGAFGYTTEQSTALIGVMIAAALIPAAAVTGLAIAWAAPLVAVGALLLLLVNIIGINLGSFLTLVAMGYEPDWRAEGSSFRDSIAPDRRTVVYGTLLVLAVATLGTGYLTATNVVFTRSVNQEVQATLDRPAYSGLSLSAVQVEYGGALPDAQPTGIIVHVSRTSDNAFPSLASRLERQIERRTGRDVTVTVAFTESRTANATRPSVVSPPGRST
jgi:uncharacterized hydrophobic protein (TIGR00341 family)